MQGNQCTPLPRPPIAMVKDRLWRISWPYPANNVL